MPLPQPPRQPRDSNQNFFLNETNKKKLIAPSDNMNLHLLPITYTYYYYLFPVQYLCDRVHFPGILVVGGFFGFVC